MISCHNEAKYLPTCLKGILAQSLQPCEIIVLDDASTDGSWEIIEDYSRLFSHIRGVRCNWEGDWLRGKFLYTRMAKGDWIDLCCADNFIYPGWYEEAMNLAGKHPEAAYIYSPSRNVREDCSDSGNDPRPHGEKGKGRYYSPISLNGCFYGDNPGGAASLLKRDAMSFLVEREVWTFGPWSDAIGYYVISGIWGCIVTEGTFGAVRDNAGGGHGARYRNDPKQLEEVKTAVHRFLNDTCVSAIDATLLTKLRGRV